MTTQTSTKFQLGSVVRYEDASNPGSTYVVIEINDNPWSTYKLRSIDTFDTKYTDGRQAGWKVLAA